MPEPGRKTEMQAFETGEKVRFENILLATDFSASSQTALLYALSMARRYRARVFIAHVVNPQAAKLLGQDAVQRALNDAWRSAQAEITNQLIEGRLEGVEHQIVVEQGEVWQELSKLIEKFNADLLVTGTRGRTGVWKILLGSTAERIFRSSPIPVLTIGPHAAGSMPPAEGPKRILYSTGFAVQSLNASKYAFSIAHQQQAHLALLHVAKDVPDNEQWKRAELERDSKQRLLSLVPPDMPAPPEIFVAFGTPAQAILKTAEHWNPDLIVLGLRRLEEVSGKKATWATAYNVVIDAPCPVLTIRAPENV
ncbi:MAG TPA: universal stress protein [Terriglobales bacterium]|nr:universal stress protein [Terriglobales bacterium]